MEAAPIQFMYSELYFTFLDFGFNPEVYVQLLNFGT